MPFLQSQQISFAVYEINRLVRFCDGTRFVGFGQRQDRTRCAHAFVHLLMFSYGIQRAALDSSKARYLSASMAAIQPIPEAVMACR